MSTTVGKLSTSDNSAAEVYRDCGLYPCLALYASIEAHSTLLWNLWPTLEAVKILKDQTAERILIVRASRWYSACVCCMGLRRNDGSESDKVHLSPSQNDLRGKVQDLTGTALWRRSMGFSESCLYGLPPRWRSLLSLGSGKVAVEVARQR